jgi:hypothetical protein
MRKVILSVTAVALTTVLSAAQDPVATLPDAYRLVLENEWVKVTRVHYAPNVKLPVHDHTAWASAYLYLNASGPVVFRHVGADYGAVTRKPTIARSIRLFRGVKETHEVENQSPLPSDFLRVEFKTDPVEPRTLRWTLPPEAAAATVINKEQFANAQVRISRLLLPPGTAVDLNGALPSLVVWLSDPDPGRVRWLPKGTNDLLENSSAASLEAVRFELKTVPIEAPQ